MAPAESPDSEFSCRIILTLRDIVNGIPISLARISILTFKTPDLQPFPELSVKSQRG